MKKLSQLCAAIALSAVSMLATASDYPSKPIRIIVPYAAGAGVDLIARATAPTLAKELGGTVIVENRPGGAALIGSGLAAKAAPDGYTLLMAGAGTHSSATALYKNVPYDPEKDFEPITNLIDADFFLVVNGNSPHNTLDDLLKWLRNGKVQAAFGYGSVTSQVAGLSFLRSTNTDAVAVSYKGNSVAMADLLGNHINFMIVDQTTGLPQIASGKVKALAVASKARRADLPNVPTTIEQGVDMTINAWVGLVAPAGLPADVKKKLVAASNAALKDPAVREKLNASGRVLPPHTPEDFAKYMKQERASWEVKVRAAGLEPQ